MRPNKPPFTVSGKKPHFIFGMSLIATIFLNSVNAFLSYFRYFGRNLEYLRRTVKQTHTASGNIQRSKKWIPDIHLVT